MRMPSTRQLKSLERATLAYENQLSLATSYLRARAISPETAALWRLGVCSSPEPGHEPAIGRLSIPYVNRLGVVGLRFRCLLDHDCKEARCPKYWQPPGQENYLFNVLATEDDHHTIHITEGELDAIVLSSVLGEPVVGLPGASSFRPHHPFHLKGFARVLVWADGDKAGRDLGNLLRKEIQQLEVVPMPSGHDVTSLCCELGAEAVRKLSGLDDEDESEAPIGDRERIPAEV